MEHLTWCPTVTELCALLSITHFNLEQIYEAYLRQWSETEAEKTSPTAVKLCWWRTHSRDHCKLIHLPMISFFQENRKLSSNYLKHSPLLTLHTYYKINTNITNGSYKQLIIVAWCIQFSLNAGAYYVHCTGLIPYICELHRVLFILFQHYTSCISTTILWTFY